MRCTNTMVLPSLLVPPWEGGLIGLQLRASNEGLLRPRVARAQETNRPPSSHQPNAHRCPFFSSSASASLGPQLPAL